LIFSTGNIATRVGDGKHWQVLLLLLLLLLLLPLLLPPPLSNSPSSGQRTPAAAARLAQIPRSLRGKIECRAAAAAAASAAVDDDDFDVDQDSHGLSSAVANGKAPPTTPTPRFCT